MRGRFILLELSAAVSLGGARRVVELGGTICELPEATPAWDPGWLWLVRVGYSKLTRPKDRAADWGGIIEPTRPLGVQTWLGSGGVRRSALPPPGPCLRPEPVAPIALEPVQAATGEGGSQPFPQARAQTGVPREILRDGGSDPQAGSAQFQPGPRETRASSEINHKAARALTQELAEDTQWKARYRTVDILRRWGTKGLAALAQPRPSGAGAVRAAPLTAAYGWGQDFQEPLRAWNDLWPIVEATDQWVRSQGLAPGCASALTLPVTPLIRTARGPRVAQDVLA